MVNREVQITNPVGLHARPAAEFVKAAQKYSSSIVVRYGEKEANAKSILGVLSLGVKANEHVTLVIDGDDEQVALDVLASSLMGASSL